MEGLAYYQFRHGEPDTMLILRPSALVGVGLAAEPVRSQTMLCHSLSSIQIAPNYSTRSVTKQYRSQVSLTHPESAAVSRAWWWLVAGDSLQHAIRSSPGD